MTHVDDFYAAMKALACSSLDMCWVAGDGNAPRHWNGAPNAANVLTLAGAPVAEVAPYQLASGANVALEGHTGASSRTSNAPRDPAAGQDAILVAWGRTPTTPAAGQAILATRDAGQGLLLQFASSTAVQCYAETAGGPGTSTTGNVVSPSSIFIAIGLIDLTANTVTTWTPGGAGASVAVPAGALVGDGIGIAARPAGLQPMGAGGGLLGCAYLLGAGIAPLWAADTYYRCRELRHRLAGTWPRMGGMPTFTRATARSRYDRNGRLWIYSSGMPAAGDSEECTIDQTSTNKCYNNINPAATTGWTATGGTHTVADDTAALAAAGLQSAGPNVHKFVPGAGDQVLYGGAATGGTTPHSLSVYLRGDAGGETVVVGLRDASSGAIQVGMTATLTTAWVRYSVDAVVPDADDQVFCLDCDAGDTIYAVLQQLEQQPVITTPIPNWATAATAARNQTSQALAITPSNAQGSIEITVTPDGWSAAEAGTVGILTRATGAPASLTCTTGTWQAALDGTTTLDSTVAPAAGVAHRIRLRWTAATMSIEVRLASTDAVLARVNGAYDGALNGTGAWTLAAGAPVSVKNLKCYRSGGG